MNQNLSCKLIENPPAHAGMMAMTHDFGWGKSFMLSGPDVSEKLRQRLRNLKDLGFTGIVCNVSEKDYLENEKAWEFLGLALRQAHEEGFRIWIYDEAGYPSGTAGGRVPRENPDHGAVGLVRILDEVSPGKVSLEPVRGYRYAVHARAEYPERTTDLTERLGPQGRLDWETSSPCRIVRYICRGAFEGTHCTLNVCAIRRYINVLEPEAVRAFLEITHRKYFRNLGADMSRVQAFFTDEPSFMTMYHPVLPKRFENKVPVEDVPDPEIPQLPMLPWWKGLPEAFRETYGYDLLPWLDALFPDSEKGLDSERAMRVRQDFHELLARQYSRAFFGQIQDYLSEHGVSLAGHVLHEEPLWQHAGSEGSIFETLGAMEIPGCDILTGSPKMMKESLRLLTPKYASSVAHVNGRTEIMSESSDWEEHNRGGYASMEQRRACLGLQSMLGVTTFTSYYNWRQFEREDIQRFIRYTHRIGAAVREGTHVPGAAILYPIRSVWARFFPSNRWVGLEDRPQWLKETEDTLHRIALDLLGTQRDFDFVDETALLKASTRDGAFFISGEEFQTLILLPHTVLSEEASKKVETLLKAGIQVIAFQPGPLVNAGKKPESGLAEFPPERPEEEEFFRFQSGDPNWLDLAAVRLAPSICLEPSDSRLFVRRARTPEAEVLLLVNTDSSSYEGRIVAAEGELAWEVWDPWTGNRMTTDPFILEEFGVRILFRSSTSEKEE